MPDVSRCEFCQFSTTLTRECKLEWPLANSSERGSTILFLCELCENILTRNNMGYIVRMDHGDQIRAICYVGNTILARIRLV